MSVKSCLPSSRSENNVRHTVFTLEASIPRAWAGWREAASRASTIPHLNTRVIDEKKSAKYLN